ncbi:uncharacterized protein [Diadema antillarum]|uniref:uncharacterized protein isoform X3 n=1 Tax=Diadema antillarum TaxID=105358 RepID=UPI003A891C7A
MSAPKVRKSRHKNPSGQHDVAGPSNNESAGPPKRQPRRLEFDPKKPLEGKKYYLELNQPRHKAQYAKFKAELEALGAVVEQFFSKELSCVISDHVDAKDTGNPPKSKGMPSGTSPAVSTPSPFHQTRDTPGAADSPSNNNQDSRVVTRGKAIVQKATKSQMYGTTDIFTNARNWKVPIRHLDVLLGYLNREKEKQKRLGKEKKRNGKEKQSQRGKERQLTKPFLKAEDMSRHFRPISKEFSTWPRILLDTRRGTCPYDPRTRNEVSHPQEAERTLDRPDASQRTPDVRHKEPSKSQSLSKKVINKAAQQRENTALKSKAAKKGFCEFCSIKYSHLDKHLQSEQHQRLVAKKNHYVNLDSMIAVGPNLDRFLEDCVRFQHNENPHSESTSQEERLQEEDEEDEVVLLTLTPVKEGRDTKQKDSRTKTKTTSTPRKRSPALHAGKQSNKDATASQGNTSTAKDVSPQDRASLLQERLGGGDSATVCDRRISGLESPDSLPDGSNLAGPHTSDSKTAKSRKRRSGSRRSLSLPPKEYIAVPTKNQGSPEGGRVVRDDGAEGLVLHGIAGEEEPIGNAGCGIEVVITRVRQVDVGTDASPVEEASNVTKNARACSPSEQLESLAVMPRDSRVCRDTPITGKSQVCEASTSSQGPRDKDAKRRSKRDSQAISSPEYRQPSRKSKRQRLAAEEVEVDNVFVDSNNSGADGARKETPPLAENANKQRDRRKRKSRKSHGEAPPRKIRGESVAADSCAANQSAVGEGTVTSPGLPEPQPRVPLTHESHTSSDDFQPMKSPASRKSGQSAKRAKKACTGSSGTALQDDVSGGRPDVQESPVKVANPGRVPGAESSGSECQFQAKSFSTGKKSSASSSRVRRHKKSAKKKKTPVNLVTQENDQVGSAIANLSQGNRVNQEEVRNYGVNRLDDNAKDNDLDKDFSTGSNEDSRVQNPRAEQSLEVVFRSDFGVEESSFLGFSQEEIDEAVSRNASFQEGRLTEKLEAAALNVYCMPSSDPNLDNDDNSSVGSFGDMTIGLVLQRVDNFPSEGSEWEEQVTGFMQKLDTQLEIKRRRESELSTLPSPTAHRALFDLQKENQMQLHSVKEGVISGLNKDGNNDDSVFYDDIPNENVSGNQASSNRRRSARINASLDEEQLSRSMLPSRVSYSGMCFSPSKKRRTVTAAKSPNASQPAKAERSRPKQALRELSSNQIPQSPQQTTEPIQFTTPERAKRNLWVNQSSQSAQHIVFPPGTPIEEQQEILDNYVHDDSESEVVFPKFSSPPQKGSVFSPVKHWVKHKAKPRHSSMPCLGQRDIQSSPIRPNHVHGILPFGLPSSRKSLFMKGRVKRINFSSPRKRSKSFSHSPRKSRRSSFSSPGKGSPEILTFLNDLRAGLSPTFYTFKKPHFSLRILQPSAVNRRGKPKISRSLLALNLCLPSNADLRIYEFHDDDSMEDEDLVISPITSDTTRTEFRDRCTQTPPSRSRRRTRPRRLSMGRKASAESSASRASVKGKIQEVELTKDKKGMRSVKLQADIPEIETILDMPLDYYL